MVSESDSTLQIDQTVNLFSDHSSDELETNDPIVWTNGENNNYISSLLFLLCLTLLPLDKLSSCTKLEIQKSRYIKSKIFLQIKICSQIVCTVLY